MDIHWLLMFPDKTINLYTRINDPLFIISLAKFDIK